MRYATRFVEDAQKVQREYYLGKIQRDTAIVMMGELMRHHRGIAEDEILVDIPDSFRKTGVYEADCEFVGEFTVRHKDSKWTWKRSFARNMPQGASRFKAYEAAAQDFVWEGPSGKRYKLARLPEEVPPLHEEEQRCFAEYDKQVEQTVTELVVSGGQRRSAQFTRFGLDAKGRQV